MLLRKICQVGPFCFGNLNIHSYNYYHRNNSDVGKAQQQVEMGLDIKKISRGTVLHELLHTLGFFHEHARPDRNKYLNIYAENVEGGMSM